MEIDWGTAQADGRIAFDLPNGLCVSAILEGFDPETDRAEFEVGLWFAGSWIWNNPANIRCTQRGMTIPEIMGLIEQARTWTSEQIHRWNGASLPEES